MDFHKLTIQQVTRITPQSVEIQFNIPEQLQDQFIYKSGQYLTINATINGAEVRRSYSISSAPHERQYTVVVKAIEGGVFSNYAMTLRAGDILEVASPQGSFIHDRSNSNDYLFIAAGSGITPIMSMIKDILKNEPESKIALIYGNQSVSQSIYYQQLNDLLDQYHDRLLIRYCFSREDRDAALFGRINKSNLNYFLQQDCGDYAFAKAYLCGPEQMINMASDNLVQKGVLAAADIYYELFFTHQNEVQITEDSHLTEVTVILDDQQHVFTMQRSDNLLDVMLSNDIDAPYSCQGGICSSCICQIDQGSAQMAKNAILTDNEIADGLTLACQAYPTSARVTVNFDEV